MSDLADLRRDGNKVREQILHYTDEVSGSKSLFSGNPKQRCSQCKCPLGTHNRYVYCHPCLEKLIDKLVTAERTDINQVIEKLRRDRRGRGGGIDKTKVQAIH